MFVAVIVHQPEVNYACRGDAWRSQADRRVVDHVARHGAKLTKFNRDLVRDAQPCGFRHVLHVTGCCVVERHMHDTTRIDEDCVSLSQIARACESADGPVGRG